MSVILQPIYKNHYDKLFEPRVYRNSDFDGIDVSNAVIEKAVLGSELFRERYDDGTLFPKQECVFDEVDLDEELLVHNYTGQCPVQTYEINPVKGCNVGCAYCLVNDGIHENPIVYKNYSELVEKRLTEQRHEEHFYYFSPKTEAFCEATLRAGVAFDVLRTFIEHYEKYPDSKARLFIASKAGEEALRYTNGGESILDLFKKLKGKMQFNTSLSVFPDDAVRVIEPYSCAVQSRLGAVRLCQENGIMANSALVQPILIGMLTEELLDEFFTLLSNSGIVNFKPEFLTACVENMALMAQIMEPYDEGILKKLFESYFQDENLDHIKQRGRTAPARQESAYWIEKMKEIAASHGITTSICYWVREQLDISPDDIPIINENGFKCLGYQTRLF